MHQLLLTPMSRWCTHLACTLPRLPRGEKKFTLLRGRCSFSQVSFCFCWCHCTHSRAHVHLFIPLESFIRSRLGAMEMHAAVEQGVLFVHSTLAILLYYIVPACVLFKWEKNAALGCERFLVNMGFSWARELCGQPTANNELYFPWQLWRSRTENNSILETLSQRGKCNRGQGRLKFVLFLAIARKFWNYKKNCM